MDWSSFDYQVGKEMEFFLLRLPPLFHSSMLYLLKGKRVRSRILYDFASRKDKNLVFFATAVELIHSISIVQDDILEDELQRRGENPLHRSFSNEIGAFASTLLLSFLIRSFASQEKKTLLKNFIKKIHELLLGEIFQDLSKDTLSIKSIEKITKQKTGSLFSLCFTYSYLEDKDLNYEKKHLHTLETLGELYGHFFQLQDDLEDIIKDRGKSSASTVKQWTIPLYFWKKMDPISFSKAPSSLSQIPYEEIEKKTHTYLKRKFNQLNKDLPPQFMIFIDKIKKDYEKIL